MTAVPAAVARALDVLGPSASTQVPIGPLTTYRVGGAAAVFVVAEDPDDLGIVGAAVAASHLPVLVLGRGSNVLVADRGFPGICVQLGSAFATIAVSPVADLTVRDGVPAETTVRAGGATQLPVLARRTVREGLTGFEWAVGVPGSVGGAVRMNAGGHGSDMAATLVSIRVIDLQTGEDEIVSSAHLGLGYRRSAIADHQVVVEAVLGLAPGDRATGEAELREIVRWRRAHQPGGQNAGSVFTNPPGDSAGRLVDEAGCRGLRQGSAAVSDKHANFIQADEGGSADDVVALMAIVRARVSDAFGVDLEPETRLVGFDR